MRLFYASILFYLFTTPIFASWPEWEEFKQHYISAGGRVIDVSSPQQITTSEGQSYALFFALVANDKEAFAKILQWTQFNLAQGDIGKTLPAWLWGKKSEQEWGVLDSNSASDADLWIAYDLLEAGRLWDNTYYQSQGLKLLALIEKQEVVNLPEFGSMLLPGAVGFNHNNTWTLNPSYLPLQLLNRFAEVKPIWQEVSTNAFRLLIETSPLGFAPNWVIWDPKKGWQPDTKHANLGSYDAIRVYLWVGMLAEDTPKGSELTNHLQSIVTATEETGIPPEEINIATGVLKGTGPVGFSAALLPMLSHSPELLRQLNRVKQFSFNSKNYYNAVLILFGSGWNQNRYRFDEKGYLNLKL